MATTTMTEHKSMWDVDKPATIPEREGVTTTELKAAQEAAPSPIPILGMWKNVDPNTGGLVKIVLGWAAGALTVHAFGACHPTPCDWGSVKGLAYGANVTANRALAFSAMYKFGFKETVLTGHLQGGSLIVESFNHFTDGSGRFDYYADEVFRR
jgi:hypothetical protein